MQKVNTAVTEEERRVGFQKEKVIAQVNCVKAKKLHLFLKNNWFVANQVILGVNIY